MQHFVVILVAEGVNLLDIAGPLQAFSAVKSVHNAAAHYEIGVVSENGGPVATSEGVPIGTQPVADLEHRCISTLIVTGSAPDGLSSMPPQSIAFVRRRGPEINRVCAVDAGVFTLAEAGLLDGRRAVIDGRWARQLQALSPTAHLNTTAIFVRDHHIWSSAGAAAAIDLTLALIEEDLGHATSMAVAQQLVVFVRRPGRQSQVSEALAFQVAAANSDFADLHAWIAANLSQDLRTERLAERCGMSVRTFSRAYIAKVGKTPARTVETLRLEAARRAIESGIGALKRIAFEMGYRDEQNLRRAFLRRLGMTPAEYRARLPENSITAEADERSRYDVGSFQF